MIFIEELPDKLQDKIISILIDNPKIKIEDLAVVIGVSEKTVYNYMKTLTESGRIVRVGARKNGYWKVLE